MNQQCGFNTPWLVDSAQRSNAENEILAQVCAELGRSAYYAVRQVLCAFHDGTLILQGRVPSYFLKQIAQTVAFRGTKGLIRIDNQVEVSS